MSTLTGKDLNLVKPALTDDHKVTIGTDLPANFQKIDDEFSTHKAATATDATPPHGLDTLLPKDGGKATNLTINIWNSILKSNLTEGENQTTIKWFGSHSTAGSASTIPLFHVLASAEAIVSVLGMGVRYYPSRDVILPFEIAFKLVEGQLTSEVIRGSQPSGLTFNVSALSAFKDGYITVSSNFTVTYSRIYYEITGANRSGSVERA